MIITNESPVSSRRFRSLPLAAVLAILTWVLPVPDARAAAVVTLVTGADPATSAATQSETAYNLSVVQGQRIETISYNDETGEAAAGHVAYTASDRVVFPGYSQLGWSFRVRTAQNLNPAFSHGKLGTPAGTSALWGDPSISSNPNLSNVVLLATLAVPQTKFPFPSIAGPVSGTCSPLGGACVARSTDGGQSFSIVNCFNDPRPISNDICTGPFQRANGHFYDGSALAITQSGNTFSGFAAFIDTDLNTEAIWKMNDVNSSPAQAFVRDTGRVGSIGDTGDEPDEGDLGEIGTHLRLRAHGADLWKMSRDHNELKVNIHGLNAPFVVVAENIAERADHGNPTVFFPNDAQGRPVTVRTGPQFAFDIGLNEVGESEMRFVYLAQDAVTGQFFLQGGFCSMDLTCSTPAQWQATKTSGPAEFHPAIKFGLLNPADNRSGVWKVTFQGEVSPNTEVVATDLIRSPLAQTASPLVLTGVSTPQAPCPDLRIVPSGPTAEYWGDYDDMGFDPVSKSFSRAFTDSSSGCPLREQLTSMNVHVSDVEISASNRVLNIVGSLVRLLDIDNCPPCNSELDDQTIDFHLNLDPSQTKPVEQPITFCQDHDVKLEIDVIATLNPVDHQTIHMCISQGLREESGFLAPSVCDENVDQSSQACVDIPPGGGTSFDDGGINIPGDASATWHAIFTNTQGNGP
jgi:hypothetical protein